MLGTRAAMFAPVRDLGLVAVWDDGDDLHADERAPYPHARDVLVQRAYLDNCAAVVAGTSRTAEAALLVESGWAHDLVGRPRRPPDGGAAGAGAGRRLGAGPRPGRPLRPPALAGPRRRPPGAGRRGARPGPGAAAGVRAVAGVCPLPRARPVRRLRRPAGHLAAARARWRPHPRLPVVRAAGGDLRLPALPRDQAAGRPWWGSRARRRSWRGPSRARPCGRRAAPPGCSPRCRPAPRSSSPRRGPSRWPRAGTARRCCSTPGRCSAAPTCGPARRRSAAG